MKTIDVLDWDDVIEENDLVRDIFPMTAYTQFSDDDGSSTVCWQYAKWKMPYWVGKTLRQYTAARLNISPDKVKTTEVCIVRTNGVIPFGFPIDEVPSQVTQKMYSFVIHKESQKNETH